jgi:hypothetical protein
MDPRRTPEKVLTGPCDQIADLTGNPGTSTAPATTRSISPKRRPTITAPTQDRLGLDDHQAFAPTLPPARQRNPKQSINATDTSLAVSAADRRRAKIVLRPMSRQIRQPHFCPIQGSVAREDHPHRAPWQRTQEDLRPLSDFFGAEPHRRSCKCGEFFSGKFQIFRDGKDPYPIDSGFFPPPTPLVLLTIRSGPFWSEPRKLDR